MSTLPASAARGLVPASATPAGLVGPGTVGTRRSCLYEGTVTHRRAAPAHRFTQRIMLPLLFLDELPALRRVHPLVDLDPSAARRRPAVMRLERDDFLPGGPPTIDAAVRAAVRDAGGTALGPVAMLGQVRTWGWLFNPLTVYFCYDRSGQEVEWTVLEVTNTPWHERHRYVVGPPGVHRFAKAMHVSPFLSPDGTYTLRYGPPGASLRLDLAVAGAPGPVEGAAGVGGGLPASDPPADLTASMVLRRRPLDRAGMTRLLWGHAFGTLRVSGGIYARAARLARLGAPVHPHPPRASHPAHPVGSSRPERRARPSRRRGAEVAR